MDKPRVSKIFDIPPYYYFESGNDYSGSKNLNQFNYKVEYGKENLTLAWNALLRKGNHRNRANISKQCRRFSRNDSLFGRNLSKRTGITKTGSEDFPLHCRFRIKSFHSYRVLSTRSTFIMFVE